MPSFAKRPRGSASWPGRTRAFRASSRGRPWKRGDAAREDLEHLAQNRLVKGIRRIIQFEPDSDFCLRPEFVQGVQALPDYELSFDLCIMHRQMANTIELVRQCPQVQFILDHIGKPDIKQQLFHPWKEDLSTLASNWQQWDMGWQDGDFTGDTYVGIDDVSLLSANWGHGVPAAAVPDPATLSLLAFGGVAVLRRPRRA